MNYAIGDKITFRTQDGRTIEGIVQGRDWWGDAILNYRVRTDSGLCYTVNAKTFDAGHSY